MRPALAPLLAAVSLLACGGAAPAWQKTLPAYYTHLWDEEVGLWQQSGTGHTRSMQGHTHVHDGRVAAGKLVAAGLDGVLDELPTGRVLEALERMQVTTGPRRGCFRWYWEETEAKDTNAAFFIGLPLIVVRHQWGDSLPRDDRDRLDRMLTLLRTWFDSEKAAAAIRYPNKYLGDLVCAWLLAEQAGEAPADLAARMQDAATAWHDDGWGWGEHISDVYGHVCLDELAMLLLTSRRLPPDLRTSYERLRDQLLAIDDGFAPGPRVPAVRSYALTRPPRPTRYRDLVRPWRPDDPAARDTFQSLRGLANALDWHSTAPPAAAPATEMDVRCFGGARARAIIDGPLRVGALSRFPLMDGIDQRTWGLSWQSFPVAAWHESGAWCFLQWATTEHGVTRMHPAENWSAAYRFNALSERVDPPPVGSTFSARHGRAFVVLRSMRRVSHDWSETVDRLRVVGSDVATPEVTAAGSWHRLRLPFVVPRGSPRRLQVCYLDLHGGQAPALRPNAFGGFDWSVQRPGTDPAKRSSVGIWVWSVDETLGEAPQVETTHDGWRLTWGDGQRPVVARVAPDAAEPLVLDESGPQRSTPDRR